MDKSGRITWFSKPIEVSEAELVPGAPVPPGQNQILQVGTRGDGTPIYKRRRGRPPGRTTGSGVGGSGGGGGLSALRSEAPIRVTETLREIIGPVRSSLVTDWYSAIAADIPEPEEDEEDELLGRPAHAEEDDVERSEEEVERWKLLSSFGDIVTHLPIELFRSSGFIRHLDQSYRHKTAEIHRLCIALQSGLPAAEALGVRERIVDLMREAKEDRQEAIAEVAKLQGIVDAQMTGLATEIEKIEGPKDEQGRLLDPPKISRRKPKRQRTPTPAVEEPVAEIVVSPPRHKIVIPAQHKATKLLPHEEPLDIPIDDDEPLYCYCQRVSFGKMIACENEDCHGGEWFHFPCLGISSAPRGKWYCDTCRKLNLDKPAAAVRAASPATAAASSKAAPSETAAEKRDRIRTENRDRERRRREKLRQRRG